jgi:iron complex outermembrane receptor protein
MPHRSLLPVAVGLCVTTGFAAPASAQPPAPTQEVVIQGDARPASSPRDPTAASTVIHSEDLDAPGASAADVLARVPGVQVRRTGARSDVATASIRGATAAQTPVYLAGVRLNDDVAGSADLSTIPLWMLHRVEVFRGNAPEHADRLGIGGAVFFEPRLPQDSEFRIGQEIGSFGSHATWLSGAVAAPRAATLVAVRREGAHNDYGYVNDAGTRFERDDDREVRRSNADYSAYDSWAIGRYALGRRARVVVLLNAFDREQGVTGLSVVPAEQSRAHVQRELVALNATAPCSPLGSERRCALEFVTTAIASSTTLRDPAGELSLGTRRSDTAGRRVGQQACLRYSPTRRIDLTVAGEQSAELLGVTHAASAFDLNALRSVSRSAATVRVRPWRPLELLAHGAVECHSTRGPDGDDSCGVFEPLGRVGTRLELLDWLHVLGNVGRYVRVPTLGELYGVAPLVRGNPDLEPEQGLAYDAGLRAFGALGDASGVTGWLDVFAYRRHVRDLVSYRRSFRQLIPFNVGRARLQGAELSGELRWRRALRTQTSLALLDPRDASEDLPLGNDILPLQSRLVLAQLLELAHHPSARRIDRLALGLRATHRSSRYQDPAGLIIIPHQTTFDAELSARLFDEQVAVHLAGTNLLAAEQWDLLGLALPGRAAYASLELVLR